MAFLTINGCGGGNTGPRSGQTAPGSPETARTSALETAANLVQSKGPVSKISMYLDGFHVSKDDPGMQMEAHHYCNQVNEDFAQCVLFDGNNADSRLMGIEYIISAKLYDTLPQGEKAYWHPHNFEVLSGQLRLPGVPDIAEKQALKEKINSYGKTWHTWMTGMYDQKNDDLPLGPPRLQWSFNRDGEDAPGMVEARDKRMGLNTANARKDRADLTGLAKPQGGVEAMTGEFPHARPAMAGIVDNGDNSTRALPFFSMRNPAGRGNR
ncbi:MAG TPA: OBAP family protein [Bryobacteraceae bacterium]|nr:OBAP family protein [Bryobacteraceae bacterium]